MGAGSATAPLDLHGGAKTASGLSNHSPELNHVCAHRTLYCSEFVILTTKLSLSYAPRILFLYRVLYVFKGLAATCAAVSFPL